MSDEKLKEVEEKLKELKKEKKKLKFKQQLGEKFKCEICGREFIRKELCKPRFRQCKECHALWAFLHKYRKCPDAGIEEMTNKIDRYFFLLDALKRLKEEEVISHVVRQKIREEDNN
jgi:transcription elongation factor Elf1